MMGEKISVIVPVYNVEVYINQIVTHEADQLNFLIRTANI